MRNRCLFRWACSNELTSCGMKAQDNLRTCFYLLYLSANLMLCEVSYMSRSSCRLSEKMSYCAINMIINVIYRPHYKWQPRGLGGAATLCKYLALINICLLSPMITIWGQGLVTTQNILCLVHRKFTAACIF